MISGRALHYVFKVAKRAETMNFFRNILGMKVSVSCLHNDAIVARVVIICMYCSNVICRYCDTKNSRKVAMHSVMVRMTIDGAKLWWDMDQNRRILSLN